MQERADKALNKGTVPIVARLKALQRPAHVAPGGARVIADFSDPNPMIALMREMNETILARSVRVESSSGMGLTLEVAGRRVLRLTEATGVSGAEACLAVPALEDEQKDDLIKVMQAVAAPRHELRVTTFPSNETGEGVSVGLPVALLADLLTGRCPMQPLTPSLLQAPRGTLTGLPVRWRRR
ncbi:MAG: hypothetical protein NTW20_06410 [Rhodobacterales bacterium]|nr:hypothetical protein [Rhodobacterales bacterium]